MKARFIKWVLIGVVSAAIPFIQQELHGKVPQPIIEWITSGLIMVGMWGLTRWLGKDVKLFQEWLISKGLMTGTPSGIFFERTLEAAKDAINDDDITVQGAPGKIEIRRATPVPEPYVKRPVWSKFFGR